MGTPLIDFSYVFWFLIRARRMPGSRHPSKNRSLTTEDYHCRIASHLNVTTTSAAASGTFSIVGDRSFQPLGYGTVRLVGEDASASPVTRTNAAACSAAPWSSAST